MADESFAKINFGLSNEEKEDLDELIKALKQTAATVASPDMALDDLAENVRRMSAQIVQFSEILLIFDRKMNSLYQIMHLLFQKSEVTNERLDALFESAQGE